MIPTTPSPGFPGLTRAAGRPGWRFAKMEP